MKLCFVRKIVLVGSLALSAITLSACAVEVDDGYYAYGRPYYYQPYYYHPYYYDHRHW